MFSWGVHGCSSLGLNDKIARYTKLCEKIMTNFTLVAHSPYPEETITWVLLCMIENSLKSGCGTHFDQECFSPWFETWRLVIKLDAKPLFSKLHVIALVLISATLRLDGTVHFIIVLPVPMWWWYPDKTILLDYARKNPFLLQEKFLQEDALNHAGSCRNFAVMLHLDGTVYCTSWCICWISSAITCAADKWHGLPKYLT